jgi:hypothetical protein
MEALYHDFHTVIEDVQFGFVRKLQEICKKGGLSSDTQENDMKTFLGLLSQPEARQRLGLEKASVRSSNGRRVH